MWFTSRRRVSTTVSALQTRLTVVWEFRGRRRSTGTSAGCKKWRRVGCNFKLSSQKNRHCAAGQNLEMTIDHFGGIMAINVVWVRDGSDDSLRFQPMERLSVYLFGATVLFASFGMGEAVYRLLFSEFDGATDRIPIEVLVGLVFAWLATKFVGDAYRNRKQRSARLNFICARNHQIRSALEGITPLAHPVKNQQSIRVIREEVDRIECALKEILPR